jgi:hypothetical protein
LVILIYKKKREGKMAEDKHVRASKVATYFGTSGVFSFGLTVLATVLYAPLSLPGLVFIGGGIALGCTEKGRGFLKKLGDQLVDLGDDLMSHVTEDVGRLGKWWHRVTAPKAKTSASVTAPAAEAASTFKGASNTKDFNSAVKPETPAISPVEPAPKPAPGPKPTL